MTDYTPCHRASDRYDIESAALENDLHDEVPELDCEATSDEYDEYLDEWLIDDLSDRAQAYEAALALEVESSEIPFPDLIKAAQVVQAAADDEF